MSILSDYLSVIIGIATILSIGAGIGMYYMKSTVQLAISTLSADLISRITTQGTGFQTLREDILNRIDMKLDNYVRTQQFKDYSESHAKEHSSIVSEIDKLREWKHAQDSNIRGIATKVDDLEQWRKVATDDISKLQTNIATNNEKIAHLEE